jgi:adenosylhomocysteine nucleosidase
MAIVEPTWLLVGAEKREFDGIQAKLGTGKPMVWPEAQFAQEVIANGARWWLVANGPGEELVKQALKNRKAVTGIISIGFCGALDPALKIGDIVISGERPITKHPFVAGVLYTSTRVAVTAKEKSALRQSTGAIAVDMEAATVERIAHEWGVPFRCVRVVSDTASEDMPLDFNQYRNAAGRFDLQRIILRAISSPFTVIPALLRLNENCRNASRKLGEFFADCRF